MLLAIVNSKLVMMIRSRADSTMYNKAVNLPLFVGTRFKMQDFQYRFQCPRLGVDGVAKPSSWNRDAMMMDGC